MRNEPLFANHNYPIFEETVIRNKRKETTFVLGDKPPAHLSKLLWCDNRTPRVKRVQEVKINGINCSNQE